MLRSCRQERGEKKERVVEGAHVSGQSSNIPTRPVYANIWAAARWSRAGSGRSPHEKLVTIECLISLVGSARGFDRPPIYPCPDNISNVGKWHGGYGFSRGLETDPSADVADGPAPPRSPAAFPSGGRCTVSIPGRGRKQYYSTKRTIRWWRSLAGVRDAVACASSRISRVTPYILFERELLRIWLAAKSHSLLWFLQNRCGLGNFSCVVIRLKFGCKSWLSWQWAIWRSLAFAARSATDSVCCQIYSLRTYSEMFRCLAFLFQDQSVEVLISPCWPVLSLRWLSPVN